MPIPLFVCHANCCRSVLARFLYEHLCPGCQALGAGVSAGDVINDRAESMLHGWGVDPTGHVPVQLDRRLCDLADGIFVMEPRILFRMLQNWGEDLAGKSYLFADPFTRPVSFRHKEYLVRDPSFDDCKVGRLHKEYLWFHERVVQIHKALHGQGHQPLVPAGEYLELLRQLS